jgi:hypothetical protein
VDGGLPRFNEDEISPDLRGIQHGFGGAIGDAGRREVHLAEKTPLGWLN